MDQDRVTKSQFKAHALEYFRQVEATGETIVVTDRGQPKVEIRRYRASQRSALEKLRGSVVEFRDPVSPISEDDWKALS